MNTAVMFVMDGVVVDSMHVNPVAFALAARTHSRRMPSLESLIRFGFEKSGLSARAKMRAYNAWKGSIDIGKAGRLYDKLKAEAGPHLGFFPGMVGLLDDLSHKGGMSFVSSAKAQAKLDAWAQSSTGQAVMPHLKEVIGFREGLAKSDHFRYVRDRYHVQKLYYVADAPGEIETARERDPRAVRVGFANAITPDHLARGVRIVRGAAGRLGISMPTYVHIDRVHLPTQSEVEASLRSATYVVSPRRGDMVGALREYFVNKHLIPRAVEGML
jgi:beta-phosphoglucomutase-like phosphatase (HAD superfamily)